MMPYEPLLVVRDPARLDALRHLSLLDSQPEPAFDRYTRLASAILGAPTVLVSLVDADRQFFKSCVGLAEPWASSRETPLSHSFCQHVVATGSSLVVADAREHPLLADNLAIPDLGVIAYLGIPLTTSDGHVLGSFCAIGGEPRTWSEHDVAVMTDLAAAVTTEIELRREVIEHRAHLHVLRLRDRALAATSNGVLITDPRQADNPIIYANPALTVQTGYAMDEVVGRNCRFLQGPETDPAAVATLRRAIHAGHETEVELVNYRKDGTPFWNNLTISPVHDSEGLLTHFVGVQRDITPAKQAEEARRIATADLQFQAMVIESVNDAVIATGPDSCIRLWNQTAERMYGWSAADVVGRPVHDVVKVRRYLDSTTDDEARSILLQHGHWQGEVIQTHRLGHDVCVEGSVQLMRDEQGAVIGVVAINRDITDRLQAREALRQSHHRTTNILESISDGFYAFDNEFRFTYVNTQAERLLERTQVELIGQNVWQQFPASVGTLFYTNFTTAMATQTPIAFEAFYPPLARWREVNVYPSRDGLSVYFRDVTARKQNEEDLRAAKVAADAANRAKSEFLATMSHELRTPLNGIIGMNEILLDSGLTSEQQEFATLARDSGQILLTLLNDILDFSKIEAGKLELDVTDMDLATLVEDTVESLTQQASAKALALHMFVAPSIPALVRGDAGRLRQIVLNLAGNAVKFTERGDVVVRVTSEAETATHVTVRVAVTDTGIGIDQEACRKLFQPFTQGNGSTTRRFGGTGLGLAICKRLLDIMGGTIGVSSVDGQGSTFWFTVALERASGGRSQFPAVAHARNGRVLVVERNTTGRDITRHYLAAAGRHVAAVADLDRALATLRGSAAANVQYDVAIIDQALLSEAGQSMLELWQTDVALRGVRLILVTPFNVAPDPAWAALPNYAGRLKQPVRRAALLESVGGVFRALPDRSGHPQQANAVSTGSTLAAPDDAAMPCILIAEDNAINQKLALAQLRKLGHRAEAVSTGREAVTAVATGDYALVLMDCQMPEMDGFEATAAIRQAEGTHSRRLPIIAMTANALPDDEAACLQAGMDDYIAKPVKLDLLNEVLGRWLTGGR